MAEMTGYSLRIDRGDLERWREAAKARDLSVSEMIRGAVETYLAGPGGAFQVTASVGTPITVTPPSRNTAAAAAQCQNRRRHKKGTYCAYCGTTP